MKRLVVLALCAVMAISTAACGTATEVDSQYNLLSKDEPITVTLWHYYAGEALKTLQKNTNEFNDTIGEEYGVTVEIVAKPTIAELEVELTEASQGIVYADEMPSMFLAYADKILELQKQDIISDMSLYLTDEDKDLLISDFLDAGVMDEEQVMLPIVKSTELMYVNDTVFEEFSKATGMGYEDLETWDGISKVAKAYYDYTDAKTPDIKDDGKAFFGMDSINNFLTISSAQKGADIFDAENGKANLDEEVLREIFEFYTRAWAGRYMDAVAKYRSDDIRSGDLLSFIGSSAGFVYMPEWIEINGGTRNIEWSAHQYPYFEGATPKVASQGAGIGVANISEQQQQACALFLNYFWEDNINFALESAYVPVVKEFIDMDEEARKETFDKLGFEENEREALGLVAEQIKEGRLHQSMPFDGSYTVRTEFGNIFEKSADIIRDKVDTSVKEGMTRDEAVESIDYDAEFTTMMNMLYETLESKGIQWK